MNNTSLAESVHKLEEEMRLAHIEVDALLNALVEQRSNGIVVGWRPVDTVAGKITQVSNILAETKNELKNALDRLEASFLNSGRVSREEYERVLKENENLKNQLAKAQECKHERQQGNAYFKDGVFVSEMHCVSCGKKIPPMPYFPVTFK